MSTAPIPTITHPDEEEGPPSPELGAISHVKYWFRTSVQEPAQNGAQQVGEHWKKLKTSIQTQSQKIHQEKVKPQLEKTYGSMQTLQQHTSQKWRQASERTQEQWSKLSAETSTKAQKFGQEVQQQSRSISIATQAAAASTVLQVQSAVGRIGESPVDTDSSQWIVKEERSDGAVTRLNFHLVQIVAAVAIVSALVSSYMVVDRLVDLACLSLLLVAPLVMRQKCQLRRLGSLRKHQNELRQETNRLHKENATLERNVDTLQQRQADLQGVEARLQDTVNQMGASSVPALVSQVHGHQTLLAELRTKLQAQITQQVMTLMLQADRDRDFTLAHSELLLLQYQLSKIPGLKVDDERFQAYLANDAGELTLMDVCALAQHLTDPRVPEEQRVFVVEPTQMTA